MACWLSEEEKEAIRRSKLIDRQLQQEKKNLRQEIKILLLGAGESGKSTFIKQMRIIHGEDYSEQDRLDFRATIYHNILKSMKILVEARRRLQIPLENPKNEENGHKVSTYHRDGELTDEEFHPYVDPLNALWKDAGIRATVKRNNEFQLVSLKRELDQFILGCLVFWVWQVQYAGCYHGDATLKRRSFYPRRLVPRAERIQF